jgi:hypothetical protein
MWGFFMRASGSLTGTVARPGSPAFWIQLVPLTDSLDYQSHHAYRVLGTPPALNWKYLHWFSVGAFGANGRSVPFCRLYVPIHALLDLRDVSVSYVSGKRTLSPPKRRFPRTRRWRTRAQLGKHVVGISAISNGKFLLVDGKPINRVDSSLAHIFCSRRCFAPERI